MYKTILIAVDINDPEGAARLANDAKVMAAASGARVHIVNVLPDTGMAIVGAALGTEHFTKVLQETQTALQAFASENLPDVAESDMHVVQGSIYDSILKTAASIDADLIVVGSHRPELRDYLVGPNAARVARHATQSVLIVR